MGSVKMAERGFEPSFYTKVLAKAKVEPAG
jgi:hypothetical protein